MESMLHQSRAADIAYDHVHIFNWKQNVQSPMRNGAHRKPRAHPELQTEQQAYWFEI